MHRYLYITHHITSTSSTFTWFYIIFIAFFFKHIKLLLHHIIIIKREVVYILNDKPQTDISANTAQNFYINM
jgi:hypothetical protein